MRILLAMWFFPLVIFWGWYGLSANDISFGYHMLSRPVHDLVFQIYGDALGIDPAKIPAMAASACVFDSFIVLGIAAFRWRAKWFPQLKATFHSYWNSDAADDENAPVTGSEGFVSGRAHPAE